MLKSINGLRHFVRKTPGVLLITILSSLLLGSIQSCSVQRHKKTQKKLDSAFQQDSFENHHSGLLVIDPLKNDTVYKKSASRYFIPASNVKIYTLLTALELIPERIPALKYAVAGDTLYFEGLGDPSVLHPVFNDSTVIKFISAYPTSVFVDSNFKEDGWPAGWSWEDYDRYFAPERSSLPIYGNVVKYYKSESNTIIPTYFKDSVSTKDAPYRRSAKKNQFFISEDAPDSLEIPMRLRPGLQAELLGSVLGRKIHRRSYFPEGSNNIVYGISRDTVLREMMYKSDNFLAEQLLLVASSSLSDTLSSDSVINHMKENKLSFLNQSPRWVDGSGLSRYNLFTPESMVQVLQLLYADHGGEGILKYFPAGGISGTLRDDFKSDEEPYIFAKSGSMGNIYCISGYLKTASGRTLIFSFMNNNFRTGQTQLRAEVRKVLEMLRESY